MKTKLAGYNCCPGPVSSWKDGKCKWRVLEDMLSTQSSLDLDDYLKPCSLLSETLHFGRLSHNTSWNTFPERRGQKISSTMMVILGRGVKRMPSTESHFGSQSHLAGECLFFALTTFVQRISNKLVHTLAASIWLFKFQQKQLSEQI